MLTFGALDALDCPHCKGKQCMFVSRRSPNLEKGQYERQTFCCCVCNKIVERVVDQDGKPPAPSAAVA